MPSPQPRTAVLCGTGSHLPPRRVDNDELSRVLDTSDEWIRSRTGIGARHWADPGTTTSDLAAAAGARAVADAGVSEVDAVVVATTTPDRPCPATAPVVAGKLGLTGVAAFDVAAVCTGFIYGLATATGLIAAGAARRVLLIGAETYSSILDPADRTTSVIFGDGAGAVVLRAGEPGEPGAVGPFDLGSDGDGVDLITVRGGGAEQRLSGREPEPGDRYFAMAGKSVFWQAVRNMSKSARAVLDQAGWRVDEVDHLVGHQANLRILNRLADDIGIPRERSITNIAEVGNTSAASIPLALDQARAAGRLRAGDRVLLTAFGGGLTWGSTTLTWPEQATTRTEERT
ncbi:beta-ketoacyl-ACP synthase III [Actinokineospora bangkokensis]|uniref:Beta-ketoacyl-[acyl-carrier-protein] synthase III n=1 Tax=Actinokineospora bangkokensis TaxID=1193682 RepID=A0A1Q9LQ09_9PSEU|nr:beta-ketoacyl-ACP synthase III [Actinokineospora bangkokensis]OLR94118.1 3-oxoacyl-ACP synthase [Actinokineospora bangkokensis]